MKLYDKHMLSSSSLCKNKEVLAKHGGEKWNQYRRRVGSMSLLNMTLVCIRVSLGKSHLVFWFPPWVWVISFDHSSALCHEIMTSDPLMSNTAKSSVVSLIYSREIFLCSFQPPSYFLLVLIHKYHIPCLVSMMWETLWPSFDQVTSCRLQLIIWEVDLETLFRYLGVCMLQWQVLFIRR